MEHIEFTLSAIQDNQTTGFLFLNNLVNVLSIITMAWYMCAFQVENRKLCYTKLTKTAFCITIRFSGRFPGEVDNVISISVYPGCRW